MKIDNIEKLPETITQKVYVHLHVSGYSVGNFYCAQCNIAGHDEDLILICEQDVTFKLPQNIDIKGRVIEGLEAEKDKIKADFHIKLKGVQDKIDNLLAIEYKPT